MVSAYVALAAAKAGEVAGAVIEDDPYAELRESAEGWSDSLFTQIGEVLGPYMGDIGAALSSVLGVVFILMLMLAITE